MFGWCLAAVSRTASSSSTAHCKRRRALASLRLLERSGSTPPARTQPKHKLCKRGGARVHCLPGANGKVDLAAVMRDLGQRQINELHVEAGFKLNGSLVREGLVDEFLVYLAPKLLGPGQGMLALAALHALADAVALEFMSAERIGPDLRLLARVLGRGNF